jgi:hypothetical protein
MHMKKQKRKRTPAEKRARGERRKNFMTIFINGKQKRVPRPQLIDGLPEDEFIARNADDHVTDSRHPGDGFPLPCMRR